MKCTCIIAGIRVDMPLDVNGVESCKNIFELSTGSDSNNDPV